MALRKYLGNFGVFKNRKMKGTQSGSPMQFISPSRLKIEEWMAAEIQRNFGLDDSNAKLSFIAMIGIFFLGMLKNYGRDYLSSKEYLTAMTALGSLFSWASLFHIPSLREKCLEIVLSYYSCRKLLIHGRFHELPSQLRNSIESEANILGLNIGSLEKINSIHTRLAQFEDSSMGYIHTLSQALNEHGIHNNQGGLPHQLILDYALPACRR